MNLLHKIQIQIPFLISAKNGHGKWRNRTKTFLKTTLNITTSFLNGHLLTLYYVPHQCWSKHFAYSLFTLARILWASTIVFTSTGWPLSNYFKLQAPQALLVPFPFIFLCTPLNTIEYTIHFASCFIVIAYFYVSLRSLPPRDWDFQSAEDFSLVFAAAALSWGRRSINT